MRGASCWALALVLLSTGCGAAGDPSTPPGAASGGTGAGTGAAPGNGGAAAEGTGSTGATPAVEPPSTVIDPVEYTTSCDTEVCTADEKCLECTFGTCCGKSCGQQLPCAAGEVTYCDRQGGPIACSAP